MPASAPASSPVAGRVRRGWRATLRLIANLKWQTWRSPKSEVRSATAELEVDYDSSLEIRSSDFGPGHGEAGEVRSASFDCRSAGCEWLFSTPPGKCECRSPKCELGVGTPRPKCELRNPQRDKRMGTEESRIPIRLSPFLCQCGSWVQSVKPSFGGISPHWMRRGRTDSVRSQRKEGGKRVFDCF